MHKHKVLIVEDEEDIIELLKYNLAKNGFDATAVTSGEKALHSIKETSFDVVLLDLMLPGINGIEVCKKIKKDDSVSDIPVIMLTARGEEEDIIKGLESGADDYITKPFSPKVLVARVKTALRKSNNNIYNEKSEVDIHELYIHPEKHIVTLGGNTLKLTTAEFKVLHLLASKPGWVLTRYQIIDEIKGDDYAVTDRSVDVLMVGLRKKLGDHGAYIETVRGVGYRFKE